MSAGSSRVSVAYRTDDPTIEFGVDRLVRALRAVDRPPVRTRLEHLREPNADVSIVVAAGRSDAETISESDTIDCAIDETIEPEGFRVERVSDGHSGDSHSSDRNGSTETDPIVYAVTSRDATGAMYGLFELAERIERAGEIEIPAIRQNPDHEFRAVKFNLPWSPYRAGDHNDYQLDTCRDLEFWRTFLDMMAENRFNVLSLWNLHPFAFLVRSASFPEACPFSDEELADWQSFWRSLFGMAADRGIDVYLVNWNVVVSPSFAEAYDVAEQGSTAEVVAEYTREVVTQTIDEYENLAGIGVTLADWMEDLDPEEKQAWFEETILEGIKRADRSVKLLNRSVLTESIDEMRRVVDDASTHENVSDVVVPTKFNWSHGHSTPTLELTHDYSSGEVDDALWDPEPESYDLVWTVRNEDFFVLRWGDPEFVRDHVAENAAGKEYVSGYVIGSEGFIPGQDYSHATHSHRTWQYAFQKQWLFYTVWGRLLYDADTPDAVFEHAFDRRYGRGVGSDLLEAYRLASRMPLALASFHASTWDYTLHAEGFRAPEPSGFELDDRRERATCGDAKAIAERMHPSFISIDDLIYHEPLDSDLTSIPEYVDVVLTEGAETIDRVTPIDLAETLEENGRRTLNLAERIESELPELTVVDGFYHDTKDLDYSGALACELADVKTWARLSQYFASKLRAGVELETFRRTRQSRRKAAAIDELETAVDHWDAVIELTETHYDEVPYRKGETFSWAAHREDVRADVEIARQAKTRDRFAWANLEDKSRKSS